ELVGLDLLEVFGNDLLREGILRIEGLQLQQQALAQIAGADADRVKFLNHSHGIFQIVLRMLSVLGEFFGGSRQITVLVQVADDIFRNLADGIGADGYAQLPLKVVGQPGGRGEELLKGRSFGNLTLLRLAPVSPRIQVMVEKSADVELVKGIGLRFLRNFFRFFFQKILVAVIVGLSGLFTLFFEHRVGDQLLGAALPEDSPIFQDVSVIRYAESFADVMIGNQHPDPRLCQITNNFLKILDG